MSPVSHKVALFSFEILDLPNFIWVRLLVNESLLRQWG